MKKLILLFALFNQIAVYAQTDFDFYKLNQLYYHLDSTKFHGFEAEIKSDFFTRLGWGLTDDDSVSTYDDIPFKVDYHSYKEINVAWQGSQDSSLNGNVWQLAKGIEGMLKAGLMSWSQFVGYPFFNLSRDAYQSQKVGDSYIISLQYEGKTNYTFINDDYIIDSLKTEMNGAIVRLIPSFVEYKNRKLLNSFDFSLSTYPSNIIHIALKYHVIEGNLMPESFYLGNGDFKFSFSFTNIVFYENNTDFKNN